MTDHTEVVIGIDIGGTSTRAVVVGRNGEVGPVSRAPGANPSTRTRAELVKAARSAVRIAIESFSGETLRGLMISALVVGMAGLDPTRRTDFEDLLGDALKPIASLASTIAPVLHTDAEIMFAAGTRATNGIVLIAGTGAIAARVASWREVATVDGHGWRLGDYGSGYSIGAGVVKRVLNHLDGRDMPTTVTPLVLDRLGLNPKVETTQDSTNLRWAIVRATMPMHPSEIASFSDVVVQAHADADPAAVALIDAAADELSRTVLALTPGPQEPIVLGGGMLAAGPLVDAVIARLRNHSLQPTPLSVEPVMGAIRIARASARWPS